MLEHCKVIDSGLNPHHALLFLYLPLMGRGQEALNRLFLTAEKSLGNNNPPAAHCKHHHLLTNLFQDRTPQHADPRRQGQCSPNNPAITRASMACQYLRECTGVTSSRTSIRIPTMGTE